MTDGEKLRRLQAAVDQVIFHGNTLFSDDGELEELQSQCPEFAARLSNLLEDLSALAQTAAEISEQTGRNGRD